MSDNLLMLLEMIEEALKEAKRDAVPDTLVKLVPVEDASKEELEAYEVETKTIEDYDGEPKQIEVVKIPIPLKTNTGLKAEKHLKVSLETYFKAKGSKFSGYKVGDPQGSGPNPDIVVTTPEGLMAFEVKNSSAGVVDYGQSDLFFNGKEWVLVSNNSELKKSFDFLKSQIPTNLNIPAKTVSVSEEEARRLVNDGLRASIEIPVDHIVNYYSSKNRFMFIRQTDSVYCLQKQDPLIEQGIPYLGDSVDNARAFFRIKNQGRKATLKTKFRFKLTQRIVSEDSITPGMSLGAALPLIFP